MRAEKALQTAFKVQSLLLLWYIYRCMYNSGHFRDGKQCNIHCNVINTRHKYQIKPVTYTVIPDISTLYNFNLPSLSYNIDYFFSLKLCNIQKADIDGDGKLSVEEYYRVLKDHNIR